MTHSRHSAELSRSPSSVFKKIYKVVAKIPKGKVMTYGEIAELLNLKNPRIVGFALHANKNYELVPCHRVVHSDGSLAKGYAFGGILEQRKRLENEGVIFSGNRVSIKA